VAAKGKNRQFPTAFKLKAIKRAEDGEGVLNSSVGAPNREGMFSALSP
jgi:hypothetical protein